MVDNIKAAPARDLTYLIGHDAAGKGGKKLVTDIVPPGVAIGPGSSVAGNLVEFTGTDGKAQGDAGVAVADLIAALAKIGYIAVTASTDLDAIRTKLAGVSVNADVTASALLGLLSKTTPAPADYFGLIDSAAGNALKAFSWEDLEIGVRAYLLATANQWTKPQLGTITSLSVSGGNIAWDLASGNDFEVTLTANAVWQFPSNASTHVGQKGRMLIRQDGTGGKTFGAASGFKVLGSSSLPNILLAANAESYAAYDVIASGTVLISLGGVGG